MKSKIDALPHHITLNDIDICLITETWIQTDQDLQILDANIKSLVSTEKINQEEV